MFGPGLLFPIFVLSIWVIGTIPFTEVVRKTSFFFLRSFSLIVLNLILNGEILKIVFLVIPGRTSSFLVQRV